jgi:hypothetical protein
MTTDNQYDRERIAIALQMNLSKLTRYDQYHTLVGACMSSEKEGDYVKFDDVAALLEAQPLAPVGYLPDYVLPRLQAGESAVMCTITAKPMPAHGVNTGFYIGKEPVHVNQVTKEPQ